MPQHVTLSHLFYFKGKMSKNIGENYLTVLKYDTLDKSTSKYCANFLYLAVITWLQMARHVRLSSVRPRYFIK